MLRLNGYSTGTFGKSHETAAWEVSPSGPTDRWPTRSGFDKFYRFLGGETNQWAPARRKVHPATDDSFALIRGYPLFTRLGVSCVPSVTKRHTFARVA